MSYISKDNLNSELKDQLEVIDSLVQSVDEIKNNPAGVTIIESSFDFIVQNKDSTFSPSSILVNTYIQHEFNNRSVIPDLELKSYYVLIPSSPFHEYNSFNVITPSSILINLYSFPTEHLNYVKFLRVDAISNGEIIQSKTIPIVKDGSDGDKGESFNFEDFTQSQLELLRGERGLQGIQGEKGETGDINLIHYNSNGETPHKIKIFTGETRIVSDGAWNIDYSHVGFSKVLGVYGNALQPSTSAGDTATGVTISSFDNKGATGKTLKGTGVGLLAGFSNLWLNDSNAKIQVMVIGY